MDIETINKRIAAGDDGVLESLRALEDVCVADETLTTPMAAAVRAGNLSALETLLGHKAALEFVPKLPDAERKTVRGRAAYDDTGTLEEREASFSRHMTVAHWERTPLLEACRTGNFAVITRLLESGAKLNARDIFGLDAPAICLQRGPDVLAQFMETCTGLGRKFPVRYELLAELARDEELYAAAVSHGSLSKDAKALQFLVSCALLDDTTVQDMLAGGHNLEDAAEEEASENPLVQAATSSLLHDIGHSAAPSLARGEVRGKDMSQSDRLATLDPPPESPEVRQKRIGIMRTLLENGLARNGYSAFGFLDAVIWANDPDLLRALTELKIQFVAGDLKNHLGPLQAIAYGCFRMVEPLVEFGCRRPKPADREHMFVPKAFVAAYDHWCEEHGLVPVFDTGGAGRKSSR